MNKMKLDVSEESIMLIDDEFSSKQIIKTAKSYEYIFNIDDDILDPAEYRGMFNILYRAVEEDTIILNINSPGGYITTMTQFIDSLLTTKASVIANVYNAYSAAAMITLCADVIRPKILCSMMCHNMSMGISGKISDVEEYSRYAKKQDKEISDLLYAEFLTKQEITEVNKGKEIWLNKQDIEQRLKTWKPLRQRIKKGK